MASPLSTQLFHGTRAVIQGNYILGPRGAWATDSPEAAKEYGTTKWPEGKVGPLKVYQVEPLDPSSLKIDAHPYMQDVKNYHNSAFKIVGEHK